LCCLVVSFSQHDKRQLWFNPKLPIIFTLKKLFLKGVLPSFDLRAKNKKTRYAGGIEQNGSWLLPAKETPLGV
jgi:hypothetical protein